ncbi:hypothetical protein [Tateyamaria sp.]|uniref:hypothetical protein n=1 Tax=Tateyamaria sp. TaxID=1929288 RepID=UPI00329AEFE1
MTRQEQADLAEAGLLRLMQEDAAATKRRMAKEERINNLKISDYTGPFAATGSFVEPRAKWACDCCQKLMAPDVAPVRFGTLLTCGSEKCAERAERWRRFQRSSQGKK